MFPVWGEDAIERDYTTAVDAALVSEKPTPEVNSLTVANTGNRPLLLLRGQLLEGGLQNRMVAQSVVVAPKDELAVSVVCVEQRRWNGQRHHADSHRRATTRVQAGLSASVDRQGEVWERVSEYETRYGANATSSLTEHANRAAEEIIPLAGEFRPFPGQIGIVVAIGGHPVSAELFDSPETLAEQYQSMVAAAAMDAVGRPAEVTPSRRVRRFIELAANLPMHHDAQAGAGISFVGANENASVSLLRWRGRDVHTSLLNPRHELVRSS